MLRSFLLVAGEAAHNLARRRPGPPGVHAALTPRQCQVLAALARGRQIKEIARDLGLSEATVKTHLCRARERLGATTRAEAVARYVRSTSR